MIAFISVALGFAGWGCGIIIHELGHVIGAKLAGLRVRWFTVSKLALYFGTGSVTVMQSPLRHYGWVSATGPRSTDCSARHRVFILGGPVVSLVGLLVGAPLFLVNWSTPPWNWFLLTFTYVCLSAGLPIGARRTRSGLDTDYEIIRKIRCDWDSYRSGLVVGRVQWLEHGPGGLRAIDPDDRAELWRLPGSPITKLEGALWLLVLAALEGNVVDAQRSLDLCESLLPGASEVVPAGTDQDQSETVHVARVVAIVICAALLDDAARARSLWSGFDPESIKRSRIRRMGEAAMELTEGRPEEAAKLAAEAWQPPIPPTGENGPTYVDFELLYLIRARAAARLAIP